MKHMLVMAGLAAVTVGCSLLEAWQPASNPPKAKSTQPKAKSTQPAGAKKVNPKDGLTYVWIPPGKFTVGCSPGDSECEDSEKPAHPVTITKGIWIGQTEVTQAAYQRVIGSNPSNFKGSSLPVEMINWDEARAYCVAAGMRLPTEAEWEYAARGGNASARYGTVDAVAWYSVNSGSKTHEVRQKQANDYGLHDMLGNVWEWVADWYDDYGTSSVSDPQGPSNGQYRTLRGGSWGGPARGARASGRVRREPGLRNVSVGVRCAGNDIPNQIESLTAQTPLKGSKRVNPRDGLTYVWIPPGTFMMGCSPGDSECSKDEKPAHRVTITKGFWIGQTEVTQAAYERVIGSNPSQFKGVLLPVEEINWDQARSYCAAVGMRLPTEAEWEYAARGGNTAARYGPLDAVAWYYGNSGNQTHEVGQKQPNGYGLYDMLGNVWEWVADWVDSYGSSPTNDPKGPSSGYFRGVRGGSWTVATGGGAQQPASVTRVSQRAGSNPRDNFGGSVGSSGVRCAGEYIPSQ